MAVGMTLLDGRYEIVSVLGEGGMGRAFLAHDHKYNAPVVVKAMHQRFINDLRFHELFNREMGFLSQFQHPNVVSLLKTGVDPMLGPFLVMLLALLLAITLYPPLVLWLPHALGYQTG